MYNHPIVAKLGQMSQISVNRCFSIDKRAAIFSNWGVVLPNLPRSELQMPDRSDLVAGAYPGGVLRVLEHPPQPQAPTIFKVA